MKDQEMLIQGIRGGAFSIRPSISVDLPQILFLVLLKLLLLLMKEWSFSPLEPPQLIVQLNPQFAQPMKQIMLYVILNKILMITMYYNKIWPLYQKLSLRNTKII